jgi:hypothetical protein
MIKGWSSADQLQSEYSRKDQANADQSQKSCRFAEQDYSEDNRTDRTDSGPHRIGSADRDRAHRDSEHAQADDHGGNRRHGRPQFGESIGIFQTDCPGDFKQTCNEKNEPRHFFAF